MFTTLEEMKIYRWKKEEKVLGLNVTVDLCLGKSALDDEEKNAINSHY